MKSIGVAALCFIGGLVAQTIKPDGIIKITENHLVDLTSCDVLSIEGTLDELNVSYGKYHVMWFKKYSNFGKLKITCEMVKK